MIHWLPVLALLLGTSATNAGSAPLRVPKIPPEIHNSVDAGYFGFHAPRGLSVSTGYYTQNLIQDKYYKPGGPIFLWVAGEGPADDGYMSGGGSLLSWLMPRYNGMVVSLEHRFYGATSGTTGRSVPTADLSPESLKLLTSRQAIEDMASFIIDFPTLFPNYNIPKDTKWVTVGGSYSGALSAWMRQQHPELVYAAYAASAPVDTESYFWRYSYAVDQGMKFFAELRSSTGSQCINGWTRAVKLLDTGISNVINDPTALSAFKSQFWLSQVNLIGDFATAITAQQATTVQYFPQDNLVNNTIPWIDLACSGQYFPKLIDPAASDEELFGAFTDLWIYQMKSFGFANDSDPGIGSYFNTVPVEDWSLTSPAAIDLWYSQACNEFGYGQVAQPITAEGLIEEWSAYSTYNTLDYYWQTCDIIGISANASTAGPEATKKFYGGLDVETSNILWVNGQYDPWHWLSNWQSAYPGQVSVFYKNSTHCIDLWGPQNVTNSQYPPYVNQNFMTSFWTDVFDTLDNWIGLPPAESTTTTVQSTVSTLPTSTVSSTIATTQTATPTPVPFTGDSSIVSPGLVVPGVNVSQLVSSLTQTGIPLAPGSSISIPIQATASTKDSLAFLAISSTFYKFLQLPTLPASIPQTLGESKFTFAALPNNTGIALSYTVAAGTQKQSYDFALSQNSSFLTVTVHGNSQSVSFLYPVFPVPRKRDSVVAFTVVSGSAPLASVETGTTVSVGGSSTIAATATSVSSAASPTTTSASGDDTKPGYVPPVTQGYYAAPVDGSYKPGSPAGNYGGKNLYASAGVSTVLCVVVPLISVLAL
ncbi:hypothetical protein HDU79_004240 [Rhizoclosmatium sp. JEL0117]|nr:hypothetical protein HDU79_004240 [Rhizoclosmatium sp. JEL0117]